MAQAARRRLLTAEAKG